MFFYQHLTPTDVPGSSRCCFTFYSQETTQKIDNYTGKRRYRFNKWQPVSSAMPYVHSKGLMFECNQWSSIIGMASAFTLDPTSTATVEIVIGPQEDIDYDPTKHQIELGVGFLKYTEEWWTIPQACDFLMKRQMGSTYNRRICTKLYDEDIPTTVTGFNSSNYAKFKLIQTPVSLTIEYTELTETGAILFTDTHNLAISPDPQHPYRIVMYMEVTPGCVIRFPLRRTVIDCPSSLIQAKERIWFVENPSDYTPPVAPLRDYGPHIYKHPNKILIEDASIELGNTYSSFLWWNILKYLVDSTVESFLFRDIDGYTFRCVFGELTATEGMRSVSRGPGYSLTMPVVVVH